MKSKNSFNTLDQINFQDNTYKYFSIDKLSKNLNSKLQYLPYSLKVLLENALRFQDNHINNQEAINGFSLWLKNNGASNTEIGFMPTRVLMQDFTGVPAIVDLAAMRDGLAKLGGNPSDINPIIPVDLVIDHSVQVDQYGNNSAFAKNVDLEIQRNQERYKFLRWGSAAFNNFRVVPPGTGICHQINIEYLASVVQTLDGFIYPDTLVGTDSHTTMVNALGVLGWGVGGIEAEAAMLGQPLPMRIPEVVGVKLTGTLKEHVNASDLVLHITHMLRNIGVVGKFVEFYGPGISNLSLADRATISNMAPEYGATCAFFPIDDETLNYLSLTNRAKNQIELIKEYAIRQHLWHNPDQNTIYSQYLELNLANIESLISGPKRPQDIVKLSNVKQNFYQYITSDISKSFPVRDYSIQNGSIVIAAITSCTNTSNPYAMIGAGLMAKNIVEKGLKLKPWVKQSFAPGSQVVTSYLKNLRLDTYLDQLGFNLVGYGCTTCIGNSGPIAQEIADIITANNLQVVSILSGNRNFEGRIHPLVKANYLASPMLVIAYGLAGKIDIDIENYKFGTDLNGNNIYLKDIWPTKDQINQLIAQFVKPELFADKYKAVFTGSKQWQSLSVDNNTTYSWPESTYINNPPYFTDITKELKPFKPILNAKILAVFGDSITTDHISPAGHIAKNSPASKYLISQGVVEQDFNSYGARRGNHQVMMRGTFANIRLKNQLLNGIEGGMAKSLDGSIKSIYDVAIERMQHGNDLIIIAGKEYGTGSSRDWAAKGTKLLGIRAVIAENFERIHRANLIGMGVLPLQFTNMITSKDLNLDGSETLDILLFDLEQLEPHALITCLINKTKTIQLKAAIFTDIEIEYLKHNTILHKVIRNYI